jgi:hypothetical protein
MLKINGKVSHKNFLILHNNFFKNFNKNKSKIRFISLNKYNKKIRNRNYTNDFKNYTYNNNYFFHNKNNSNISNNFEKNIVLNSINNFIINNFI